MCVILYVTFRYIFYTICYIFIYNFLFVYLFYDFGDSLFIARLSLGSVDS